MTKKIFSSSGHKARLKGVAVTQGVGIGRAHLLDPIEIEFDDTPISPREVPDQIEALRAAQRYVRDELRELKKTLPENAPDELSAFLDIHLLILQDPILTDGVIERIKRDLSNAQWALKLQIDDFVCQFDSIADEYLRQRGDDIRQVGARVLRALTAVDYTPTSLDVNPARDEPLVIVARDISPADMLQFKRESLAGIVTELGGTTSHTALLAKSLGIPAILAVKDLLSHVMPNDLLVLDTQLNSVMIEPTDDLVREYQIRQTAYQKEKQALLQLKNEPAKTLDGIPIELFANVELPEDAGGVLEVNADGIGLFRSEFLFLKKGNKALYDEEEQFIAYKACVEKMQGKPVAIRTIDIGADKLPDAANSMSLHFAGGMPNPALALRAIRWSLSDPEMFKTQLRAILRASYFGAVKIMLPMITFYREITKSREYLEEAKAELRSRGELFDEHIPLGIMVEVPSCALSLPQLLPLVDFISVGTNDLVQYLLAVDRADATVSHLYTNYHPAFLRLLRDIINLANKAGKPVTVCGEVAGDTNFIPLLVAMGLTRFSMHPIQILEAKKRIRSIQFDVVERQLSTILQSADSIVAKQYIENMKLTD